MQFQIRKICLMAAQVSAVTSALAQAPADPFLAPAEKIVAMLPDSDARIMEVRLDVDVISLSHEKANSLIREMEGATTGGTKIRQLALAEVAAGRGQRLQRNWIPIRVGWRSLSESHLEFPFPTEFDPAQMSMTTSEGGVVGAAVSSATPQSFEFSALGWRIEAEVSWKGPDQMLLNMSYAWETHLGQQTWSQAENAVEQPDFQQNQFSTRFPLNRGEWMLAGLWRQADGVTGPLRPERALIFVRPLWAEVEGQPLEAPVSPPPAAGPAAGLLFEWLETSQEQARELMGRYPGIADGPALRAELQRLCGQEKASLFESSYQLTSSGLVENNSGAVMRNDADQAPSSKIPTSQRHQPKPDLPLYSKFPYAPRHFEDEKTGTSVRAELSADSEGKQFSINAETKYVIPLGIRRYAEGNAESARVEFARAVRAGIYLMPPDSPRLMAVMDALPPSSLATRRGLSGGSPTDRRWFVFVTVLP
jgi:hypothetical protein